VDEGRGGLRRIVVSDSLCDAEIYLHGAQVTHFQPRGCEPLLFLSQRSFFAAGKPIRGGVPICFPWFGPNTEDPSQPAHGFARLVDWQLESITRGADGTKSTEFSLRSGPMTRRWWSSDFIARYQVTSGAELSISLAVHNPSVLPIRFEAALHTYLHVGDVRQASVTGLERSSYLDKMLAGERVAASGAPVRFTGETDRVYLATRDTCIVHDPVLNRRLVVEKSGSESTVVWNPWIAKAKSMQDFDDDEWPRMLCIETANVGQAGVTLAANQSHTMTVKIRAEK